MRVRKKFRPKTPFGYPSDYITVGEFNGVSCAFLPRHGRGHRFLPSEIPQRANFYALKLLGVEHVVAISACGSLKEKLAPRHIVIPNQLIDRTSGRPSTFFGDGIVAHVSFANPFSKSLSDALEKAARFAGAQVHRNETYVCTEGPAFSTRAESLINVAAGAGVVGMTALPEARFAREAEMSYAMLAMVTDFDCWKEDEEVTLEMVIGNLRTNTAMARAVIARLLPEIHRVPNDSADALKGALFTDPRVMPARTKKRLEAIIRKYVK
jgi:5'-methylthioadenosine phosphorylase